MFKQPYLDDGAWTDQPKSAILRSPLMPSNRFSGLISLWITFLEWQYCSASANWPMYCGQRKTRWEKSVNTMLFHNLSHQNSYYYHFRNSYKWHFVWYSCSEDKPQVVNLQIRCEKQLNASSNARNLHNKNLVCVPGLEIMFWYITLHRCAILNKYNNLWFAE